LLLTACTADNRQVVAELIKDGDVENLISKFLEDREVAYVHLRDAEWLLRGKDREDLISINKVAGKSPSKHVAELYESGPL
jgi:hypothetical protein